MANTLSKGSVAYISGESELADHLAQYLAPHSVQLTINSNRHNMKGVWEFSLSAICRKCGNFYHLEKELTSKVLRSNNTEAVSEAARVIKDFCSYVAAQECLSAAAVSLLAERVTKLVHALGPITLEKLEVAYLEKWPPYTEDPSLGKALIAVVGRMGFMDDDGMVVLPYTHPYRTEGA